MVTGQLVRIVKLRGQELASPAPVGIVYDVTQYGDDWKRSDTDLSPGYVVSVRWQGDLSQTSTHVFFEGEINSVMDFGPVSTIKVQKQE